MRAETPIINSTVQILDLILYAKNLASACVRGGNELEHLGDIHSKTPLLQSELDHLGLALSKTPFQLDHLRLALLKTPFFAATLLLACSQILILHANPPRPTPHSEFTHSLILNSPPPSSKMPRIIINPAASRTMPTPETSPATVYLVGAGPGDPNLLTLAGAEALRKADVIIYDYLANPALLNLAPPHAERIYVGKSANQHTKTQDQINSLLVEKARELQSHSKTHAPEPRLESRGLSSSTQTGHPPGNPEQKVVVRLKGGDPYVFGRGGEEAEHLRAHNIPFIEIPGITSGIAAPAYAGIPVTHRDFASTITLVTGHEKEEESPSPGTAVPGPSRINYEALAKLNGTLVFYMGVKSLPLIVERLTAGGLDPNTPAAVIRWGTHPNQQTVTAPLKDIAAEVQRAGITAPAITIVGKVVSLRPTLNWFEQRPLFGQRILVTRTRQQASELSTLLTNLGAQVLEAPTIELAPPDDWTAIDQTLHHIPAYDWIVFTSPNGVRAAYDRLLELGFDSRHFGASSIAAIGPSTAKALKEIGIIPDLLPDKFVGEELAKSLLAALGKSEVAGKRFLLLRADLARPALREELQKLGATVDDLPIYQTQKPESLPEEVLAAIDNNQLDWVTFTSASTATNLWDLLTTDQRTKVGGLKRASIGPITSAAMKKLGTEVEGGGGADWKPTLESTPHTILALVQAIVSFSSRKD